MDSICRFWYLESISTAKMVELSTRCMEDTSLDAFVESDSEGDADPEEETVDIESATSTARWGQDGQVCEQCGTAANRLWNDDGAFVCTHCKDW
jgi:formamidopyrimidine-DNA glycosylase